jgi:hypothetical protein
MKKLYFLLFSLLLTTLTYSQPVINEVDADTPGTDTLEFIEIFWTPNTALDGYVVVLFNGSSDISYGAYDLDGFSTDANGFFILGNSAVFPEITFAGNFLQNGQDAVAIYLDDATNFPNGTAITATNLVGGVVYDTDDADDAGLLAVIGGIQYNENEFGASETQSVQRKLDGTYEVKNVTLRSDNAASCGISLGVSSIVCSTNTAGANNDNVTIEIPYTGSDAGITSVTTLSLGTVGGDDPATTADGTITITGLSEGDAWDITINGGNCDGTISSGTVSATACDPVFLIINEINADPDTINGDANGDTVVNGSDDEFIEIYNSDSNSIDLENYTLEDGFGHRHTFPAGSIVAPSGFITVFGGGTPTGIGGVSQIASSGALGLNNGGDTVTLKDNGGFIVLQYIYGSEGGDNQSIGRDPDFTGLFVKHSTIIANPVLFSPGEKNDGTSLSTNDILTNTFKIYPNPTSLGYVNISSRSQTAMNVSVFDILGKQVINTTVTNERLDVSKLNSGVYVMKISQDNATTTKKLVIK